MSPRPPLLAAASVAACLLTPASASATTAADAIAHLNAQRAAHGLPADVVENPRWSEGCRLHNVYRAANGTGADPHDEDPGLPHYTDLGREAARSSVLASGGWPADGSNPWEYAPIHLMQLLAPDLAVTGWADGCMWTFPGYTRPAPEQPHLLSYPGDGASIYPEETADEWPFTPGEFVGLGRATTGPHLYVFAPGTMRSRITAATLTGPDGPVEVRTVDNHTSGAQGELGPYLPSGGIVIPVAPLRAGAEYSASATVVADDRPALTRRWTFTTGPPGDATPDRPGGDASAGDGAATRSPRVRIASRIRRGRLTVLAGRAVGQPATVRAAHRHARRARERDADPQHPPGAAHPRPAAAWHPPRPGDRPRAGVRRRRAALPRDDDPPHRPALDGGEQRPRDARVERGAGAGADPPARLLAAQRAPGTGGRWSSRRTRRR